MCRKMEGNNRKLLSIAEWTDRASALSSPMKLTSSASFSPSIRISLRLKIYQAQAKNFCRVLDIRVSHIMEAYARQPRPLEQRLHVVIRRVRVHGVFRFYRVGEYPLTERLRFAPTQNVSHAFRQDDGAHARISLCLAEGVLALFLAV